MLSTHTLDELLALEWREHPANPLVRAPFPSPIIADPTVATPAESPDGRWHLFAHSLRGIHHFTSDDGVGWTRRPGVVVRNALRASLHRDGDVHHLLYERTRLFLPMVPWSSRIEVRTSADLVHWSAPHVLLRPSLGWHLRGRSRAVGNPCLVRHAGGYRLYYSAGLVRLADCGFDEPRHVGIADGPTPLGPFTPHPEPILSPHADDPFANVGAGALKVVPVADGFLGLQNGIYVDAAGASRSAVRWLTSRDGVRFAVHGEPFLRPDTGWKRSHVYAVDLCAAGDTAYLYFNARDDWHWSRGREAIGLVTARLRAHSS
jgi:hypothetical protein